MRKFWLILVAFICAFGININEIDAVMRVDLDKTLKILQDKNLNDEEKSNRLFEMFDAYFDYNLMAKLSISKHYANLTSEERAKFTAAFEKRLKKSFTEKLAFYTDQKIEIVGSTTPNDKRYFLETKIENNGEIYKILFKFYRANGDDFLIYDIDILGVSIIQTYRTQFNSIKNASFNELIQSVETATLPEANAQPKASSN